jgi:hypothetical protein
MTMQVAISTWQRTDGPDYVKAKAVWNALSPLTIQKRKANADAEKEYSRLMAEAGHVRERAGRLDFTIGSNNQKILARQAEIA